MYLSPTERQTLEQFVKNNPEGTAYRRRAQILLLYDDGVPPELSAGRVGVSIYKARHFLRAFNRQRLALFPAEILTTPPGESAREGQP